MNEKERSILKSLITSGKTEEAMKQLNVIDTEIQLEKGTPLNYAVNYEQDELVIHLIKRGADVNAKYDKHYTPLMAAVDNRRADMVKLLLENGADVNAVNKNKMDAIWFAATDENEEIVNLLIEHGANPFRDSGNGMSAYAAVAHMGLDEMLVFLDSYKDRFK